MRSKMITGLLGVILLAGCFDLPEISVPHFIPKSPPDSLQERGIDAHPDNAVYLEWEEPGTVEEEGIQGYYIYRGTLTDQEYAFERIATVDRSRGVLYDSDSYIDNTVHLDTTYYYYLRSYNDFAVSEATSDTAFYKLARKAILQEPAGNVYENTPRFYFTHSGRTAGRINYFYLRLFYLEGSEYRPILFAKRHRFDLGNSSYYVYLNGNDSHTTVLYEDLWTDGEGQKYLEKGNYRWRVDAVSGEVGGGPEAEGSESDWMYFTVK
ncbi:MAG: hypothetical protein U5N26_02145 [Candidatus Marinimicrobia bacterium]|nr:hypothetical protein [Candidatus Neomarinimicrobiota bacterium]